PPIIPPSPPPLQPAPMPEGAPPPAKEPPRFTFPPEKPALPSPPPVNLEPTKPPAFRIVAPLRRPNGPPPSPEPFSQSSNFGQPSPPFAGSGTLSVQKRGPSTAPLGQSVSYEIIVRNDGSATAERVRVQDEIPRGARLIAAQPQPAIQGDRLIWTIDTLPPGREARLRVDVEPTATGELTSTA